MAAVIAIAQLVVPLAKSEEGKMGTSDGAQESGSMYLLSVMQGGVLNDAETAKSIATLLLTSLYGNLEEKRQEPLLAIDQGDKWLITSSKFATEADKELGTFKAILRKSDCAVLYIALERSTPITPDAKAILDRELKYKP